MAETTSRLELFLSSGSTPDTVEQYRAALNQLVEVPAAREASLEVLRSAAFEMLQEEQYKKEGGGSDIRTEDLMNVLSECGHVTEELCRSDCTGWTPLLFDWSLGLLAEMCHRYDNLTKKELLPLDKRILLFTGHSVIGKIVQVVKKSMSLIMQNDPVKCVDRLLTTVQSYRPHFDWMLAHCGAMFCATLVPALLHLGLTEFVEAKGSPSEEHVSRIIPVLEHLILRHRSHLQLAFMELFQDSLKESPSTLQLYTVPFLIYLSFRCSPIASLLVEEGVAHLKQETLELIHKQMTQWTFSHNVGSQLLSAIIHLQSVHAFIILRLLADLQTECEGSTILSGTSMSFMDSLLVQLNEARMQEKAIPLLSSLQQHAIALVDWLVSLLSMDKSAWLLNWLRRLVVLIGLHSGREMSVAVLKQFMAKEPHSRLPSLFAEVQCQFEQQFPGAVQDVLDALMADIGMSCQSRFHSKWLLTNLLSLLLMEKDNPKQLARSSCMVALRIHLATLASLLLSASASLASTVLQILLLLFGQNFSLSLSAELALCQSCCSFYFSILCDNQSPPSGNRLWCLQQCKRLLAVITRRSTAQFLVVRLVVEKLIELGSELSKLPTTANDFAFTSLLEANRKQDSSLGRRQISRAFSQTSQATVAGQALLRFQRTERQRMRQSITQWAVDLVHACCTDPIRAQQRIGVKMTSSGAHSIAAALVDLTAPVCIYPGGWPTDEESLKWTLEKDLAVKRFFEDHPVLWQLLQMVAPVPGALSVCKPVIASLLASQISFWKHCRQQLTKQAASELQATVNTVQAITQAGWLPSQTETLPHWLSFLTPDETCRLLLAIMQHVKCGEQTGDSHRKSNGSFDALLDTVRNVLQANIGKLGYLYPTIEKR